ncbi:MAG: redoxin [Pseudanabaena sp.]|nr:MAG: redoxin [Pseudanabaena sp.]
MDKKLWQRRRFLTYAGLGLFGAGSAAIASQILNNKDSLASVNPANNQTSPNSSTTAQVELPKTEVAQTNIQKLPEFQGISQWLNSAPLSVQDLRGNVVLVQIWTFGCINCQRTLPYITGWHEKYTAKGLKVIGIHTPEFAFERDVNNIKDAMQKNKIYYPVGLDNEFKTWRAYNNEYWPHLFLADRQGNLRYDHIGEGAYSQTEQTIQQLLSA